MTEPAEPAIDDGYAQAAAEDRAGALAARYEQAQAAADEQARALAAQPDRDAELDARQMDAQHQEALADNAARQAQTREPEAGV